MREYYGSFEDAEYDEKLSEFEQRVDPAQAEIQELKNRINSLMVRIQSDELEKLTEKLAREDSPTLQDAWEQYQSVLRLTQNK